MLFMEQLSAARGAGECYKPPRGLWGRGPAEIEFDAF